MQESKFDEMADGLSSNVRIHGEVESFLWIFVNASDGSSYVALCSSGVAPMTLIGTSYA